MRKYLATVFALLMVGSALAGLALALDPTDPNDAKSDPDGDQLTNLQEFIHGTDPNNFDSDNGGCDDGWEVYFDENRASWPQGRPGCDKWARYDGDGDGINEVNVDPNYIFDPTNKLDELDLADQDGWANLKEYQAGTDPTNPDTDGDGRMDDVDPNPLIPDPKDGPGGGGNSGMCQGTEMGIALSASWDSFVLRGF